jgi:hypothetical protein
MLRVDAVTKLRQPCTTRGLPVRHLHRAIPVLTGANPVPCRSLANEKIVSPTSNPFHAAAAVNSRTRFRHRVAPGCLPVPGVALHDLLEVEAEAQSPPT